MCLDLDLGLGLDLGLDMSMDLGLGLGWVWAWASGWVCALIQSLGLGVGLGLGLRLGLDLSSICTIGFSIAIMQHSWQSIVRSSICVVFMTIAATHMRQYGLYLLRPCRTLRRPRSLSHPAAPTIVD